MVRRICAGVCAVMLLGGGGVAAGKEPGRLAAAEAAYPFAGASAEAMPGLYGGLASRVISRWDGREEGRVVVAGEPPLRPVEGYEYDPVILTIAAGIESRGYDRGPRRSWQTLRLPLPGGDKAGRYYRREVPAHVYLGAPSADRMFVIFNSSYSTWERGSWTNKMVALLRARYGDPHIVVFAGFLTPEFLDCEPMLPALDCRLPARDLHWRLAVRIADWQAEGRVRKDVKTGLIGFSGGANMVISLLAVDSAGPPLFNQGGMSLSPILDPSATFDVLDRTNAELTRRGYSPRRALTTPVIPDVALAFLRGYSTRNPKPYLRLALSGESAMKRRADVVSRFYREFEIVDLATVRAAGYRVPGAADLKNPGDLPGHAAYYEKGVFPLYQRHFHLAPRVDFRSYTRIEPELAAIKLAPLYLLFAADDPVLSRSGVLEGPPAERCAQVLAAARENRRIRVFHPRFGGHMGYMADNRFMDSLTGAFFR